jgi:hypothetical protein
VRPVCPNQRTLFLIDRDDRVVPRTDISGSYSITSSAVICIMTGTTGPSAFAVFRLMTNSNLVGC